MLSSVGVIVTVAKVDLQVFDTDTVITREICLPY